MDYECPSCCGDTLEWHMPEPARHDEPGHDGFIECLDCGHTFSKFDAIDYQTARGEAMYDAYRDDPDFHDRW